MAIPKVLLFDLGGVLVATGLASLRGDPLGAVRRMTRLKPVLEGPFLLTDLRTLTAQ